MVDTRVPIHVRIVGVQGKNATPAPPAVSAAVRPFSAAALKASVVQLLPGVAVKVANQLLPGVEVKVANQLLPGVAKARAQPGSPAVAAERAVLVKKTTLVKRVMLVKRAAIHPASRLLLQDIDNIKADIIGDIRLLL